MSFATRKMLKKDGKKHQKIQPNAVTVCFFDKKAATAADDAGRLLDVKLGMVNPFEGTKPPTGHGGPITCSLTCGGHELYPVMSSLGYLAMQATRLLFGSLGPRNQTRDNGVWHDKRQKFHEISI